jgi:hypothetical protein
LKRPQDWSTRLRHGAISSITIPQRDSHEGDLDVSVAKLMEDAGIPTLPGLILNLKRLIEDGWLQAEVERFRACFREIDQRRIHPRTSLRVK